MTVAAAQTGQAAAPVALLPQWPVTELQEPEIPLQDLKAGYWVDTVGKATLADALRAPYQTLNPHQTFYLSQGSSIWVRMRVRAPADALSYRGGGSPTAPQAWVLSLPMPLVDQVEMLEVNAQGQVMTPQVAGDTLPNKHWTTPSNQPTFGLNMTAGEPHDVLLRITHTGPLQVPLLLQTSQQNVQETRLQHWYLGLIGGCMVFLMFYALAVVLIFREWTHAAFAFYVFATLSTALGYTGIAGNLYLTESPRWVDVRSGFWQFLSVAGSLVFVGLLSLAPQRAPRWYKVVVGLAALCVLSATVFLLDKVGAGAILTSIVTPLAGLANLVTLWLCWRQSRDRLCLWLGVYSLLTSIIIVYYVLAAMGVYRAGWYNQFPLFALAAVAMPLMLIALNMRMRNSLAIEVRAQGIRSHDALTGMLNEPFIRDRTRELLASARRRKNAAVVVVSVSNLPHVQKVYGQSIADQTLLRATIKIKRIFGEVESVGRLGDNRICLLVENASRERLNKMAVELIASGLMPPKNLKPEITLIFHFAVALLDEHQAQADELLASLEGILDTMSSRTQRPIRYLEARTLATAAQAADAGHAPQLASADNDTRQVADQESRGFAASSGGISSELSTLPSTHTSAQAGQTPTQAAPRADV